MPAKFKFERLLDAAKTTGELRSGDVEYVRGLWRGSLDHARAEQSKQGLKVERQNVRKACQTIARLTISLRRIAESYGVRGPDEHPTNAGGDAIPSPTCFCPFCVASRAIKT